MKSLIMCTGCVMEAGLHCFPGQCCCSCDRLKNSACRDAFKQEYDRYDTPKKDYIACAYMFKNLPVTETVLYVCNSMQPTAMFRTIGHLADETC